MRYCTERYEHGGPDKLNTCILDHCNRLMVFININNIKITVWKTCAYVIIRETILRYSVMCRRVLWYKGTKFRSKLLSQFLG
jgi:hypothetical protein